MKLFFVSARTNKRHHHRVDSGEHLSIDMSKIVRKELQIEENQVT
jgi:hypothetical protein